MTPSPHPPSAPEASAFPTWFGHNWSRTSTPPPED